MEEELLKAIDEIRDSRFGATAVKVELEAQLNRGSSNDCDYCEGNGTRVCEYCDEGSNTCNECEGDWENQSCTECDEGHIDVVREDENGVAYDVTIQCEECDGTGSASCTYCDEGYRTCGDCDGSFEWDCDDCDGHSSDFGSPNDCHDWFMKRLEAMGLAEKRLEVQRLSHIGNTNWFVLPPLTYAEFYRDGSVDSEFTYTILLNDSNSIFLVTEIMQMFKDFAEEVGNGMDIDRAGMHIALLQDVDGRYPIREGMDNTGFENFKYATPLLPALYFLASPDGVSRSLEFRKPQISDYEKYSAIYYQGRALEFRIFDTCYDNPDQIYDNVIIMANMLRYWTDVRKNTGLGKYARQIRFGNNESSDVKRFFKTTEQLDWLNAGLRQIKPKHLNTRDIKATRKFNINKSHILHEEKKFVDNEIENYHFYYDDYMYRLEVNKKRAEYEAYQTCNRVEDAELMARIAKKTREIETMHGLKQPVVLALEKLQEYKTTVSGQYTITA